MYVLILHELLFELFFFLIIQHAVYYTFKTRQQTVIGVRMVALVCTAELHDREPFLSFPTDFNAEWSDHPDTSKQTVDKVVFLQMNQGPQCTYISSLPDNA